MLTVLILSINVDMHEPGFYFRADIQSLQSLCSVIKWQHSFTPVIQVTLVRGDGSAEYK